MLVPKYAQSCNDIDLKEIERCYSDVIGKDKENTHAECFVTRTVNIEITILAGADEVDSILSVLNDPNFVSNVNSQLPGEQNDIGSAGTASGVAAGNLI